MDRVVRLGLERLRRSAASRPPAGARARRGGTRSRPTSSRVDAIEQHLQKPLLDVSKANRDFAGKKSGISRRAERARARSGGRSSSSNGGSGPSRARDAAHLRALLLALVAREDAIAGEVVQLATFIPAYGAALAPLAPASVAVKHVLALKTASIADKAAALDRYGAALAPVIAKLRTLRPPSASRPVWAQQIATLATDSFGNTSTATFTVFVHDSTPPVFTSVSPNLVIEATSAAVRAVVHVRRRRPAPIALGAGDLHLLEELRARRSRSARRR